MSGSDFELAQMAGVEPDDLAALHARAFAGLPDSPWSAVAFRTLLGMPGVSGFAARDIAGNLAGFVIGRQGGGEGEILTICTAPERRRQGLASALLASLFVALADADRLYLEVAETNGPARTLYEGLGFSQVGRRPGYYAGGGRPADALVLVRERPV